MRQMILLVLNNFKNDSRVLKESISLQNAGYKVRVVALHEEPLKEYEEIEGIDVHRVKLKSRGWSKSAFIQIFKYIEFVYKFIKLYKNSDILHCNDLNTLPIGVIVKRFFNRNVKIVYDAHEYESETIALSGIKKSLVKWLERVLIKDADCVITVSETIANEYVRLYGIKKPALVLNTPPYKEVAKKDLFREQFNIDKSSTIFLYQGALTRGRGIEVVLETFKKLNKEVNKSAVIVFMGYGELESDIKEASKEYSNIYFHEAVSPDILLDYTSSADFGISTIEDRCLSYRYCLPNKMFEYLMANIPVIVSNLPEMKRIIKEYQVGVVAKENSADGLKDAIKRALELDRDALKEQIERVKELYNWQEQEKVLLACYKGLELG